MIKVAQCSLCGKFYRTGQIRQVIVKWLGDSTGGKSKFVEDRMAVCNGCYGRIIKGEGVLPSDTLPIEDKSIDNIFSDIPKRKTGIAVAEHPEKPDKQGKKERKPRGKRVNTKDSIMAQSLASSNLEDEDRDEKPKEKKQRKERSDKGKRHGLVEPIDKDPLATEASQSEETLGIREEDDVVIPTQIPSSEMEELASVTQEETFKAVNNARDRATYKEQVREALASKGTITYEEIAKKLGIDEGIVSQLADEIDVEG